MPIAQVFSSETRDALDAVPHQEEVLALYDKLKDSGMPHVIEHFEKVVGSFVSEIQEQRQNNESLQRRFDA